MGSKKIKKTLAKFDLGHQMAKKMGLPDPSGDLIYGSEKALSPAEQAQKQGMDMARQQAQQAEQQMQMQMQAANEAAAQSAMMVQQNRDREIANEEVAAVNNALVETPTIELAGDIAPGPVNTRKKYRGQIGGATGAPSVRV